MSDYKWISEAPYSPWHDEDYYSKNKSLARSNPDEFERRWVKFEADKRYKAYGRSGSERAKNVYLVQNPASRRVVEKQNSLGHAVHYVLQIKPELYEENVGAKNRKRDEDLY